MDLGKLDMLSRLLRRPHATAAAYVAVKHPRPVLRALHSAPVLRAIDMAKVDTTERLAELRTLMKERNVDVYSNHLIGVWLNMQLISLQWCRLKTATRASTLHPVMRAEVSYTDPVTAPPLTSCSIHQRLHWLGWLRGSHARESGTLHRRTLFQPGGEAAGRQLGATEAGHTGRTHHTRMDRRPG